jgi:O-antigen/teichoic acid export membrane protein
VIERVEYNGGAMHADTEGDLGPVTPVAAQWRAGLRGHRNLIRGSAWLTASVAANAVSGFSFWLLAARTFDERPIGQAAGLFTGVLFVNYLTTLGLPIAVGRYAPDRTRDSDVLFGWALAITTATSALGATLFWLLAGDDILEPLDRLGALAAPLAFFTIIAGMSIALLVDIRLTALRHWRWVLARVALVGVIRLPLIPWNPVDDPALWLFILVAAVPAGSALAMAGVLGVRGRARLGRLPATARSAVRFALVNYAGLLALQAPQFVLPLVVALGVSADDYSTFYIAFQIATVAYLVPQVLAQVLLVEGGRDSADLAAQMRVALLGTVALMATIALGGLVLARVVPLVYGDDYEASGQLLPILLSAGVAWAVTSIVVTGARVVEVEWAIITIAVTLAAAILGPAILLTQLSGVDGAAVAWLVGHLVAAVVALAVRRRLNLDGAALGEARTPDAVVEP